MKRGFSESADSHWSREVWRSYSMSKSVGYLGVASNISRVKGLPGMQELAKVIELNVFHVKMWPKLENGMLLKEMFFPVGINKHGHLFQLFVFSFCPVIKLSWVTGLGCSLSGPLFFHRFGFAVSQIWFCHELGSSFLLLELHLKCFNMFVALALVSSYWVLLKNLHLNIHKWCYSELRCDPDSDYHLCSVTIIRPDSVFSFFLI